MTYAFLVLSYQGNSLPDSSIRNQYQLLPLQVKQHTVVSSVTPDQAAGTCEIMCMPCLLQGS